MSESPDNELKHAGKYGEAKQKQSSNLLKDNSSFLSAYLIFKIIKNIYKKRFYKN